MKIHLPHRILVFVTASLLACAWTRLSAAESNNSPCGLCYASASDGTRIILPLESTEVVMNITPGLIETEVIQTFSNHTTTALEATYLYPLPHDATVTQYELRYDQHVVASVVREKKIARAEYESAKAEGRKAALLEQRDASLFSTAVANFLPGETVQVAVRFIQPLTFSSDAVEIRFPMVTGEKYFPADVAPGEPGAAAPTPPKVGAAAVGAHHYYAFDILIDGFPVQAVLSPSHQIKDSVDDSGRHHIALAENITIPDRDFLLHLDLATGEHTDSSVVTQQTASGTYGQLAVFPPATARRSAGATQGRDILFLLDHSGSMQGPRIESMKLGVAACLATLSPNDRFQIVVFDSLFAFYRNSWVPASSSEVGDATRYISGLQADSGTEMQPALSATFDFIASQGGAEREKIIFFMTDGDVGNEADLFRLIETKGGQARLFTFGIGSAPNAHLVSRMAELGRGQARFIEDDRAVGRELGDLFATLDAPVLTDLHLTLLDAAGQLVAAQILPEHLGDVFARRPLQAMFAVNGPAPITALLEAKEAGVPVSYRLPLNGTALRGDGLEKQFGRLVYQGLEDARRQAGRGTDVSTYNQQMLQTALRFQLVTEFTSRVAVDRKISRQPGSALATAMVPQYHPADQAGEAVPESRQGEALILSPFVVEATEDSGYTANDTLAGTRLRTELRDVASGISVVTKQFLQDVAAASGEDLLPYLGAPLENPGLSGTKADDSALLNNQPIATPVDIATVERIQWSDLTADSSGIIQREPGYNKTKEFALQFGEDGRRMASLQTPFKIDDHNAALAIASWANLGHPQASLLLGWRRDLDDGKIQTEVQARSLSDYGHFALARATWEHRFGTDVSFLASFVGHELTRKDPQQFALHSPATQYDGLGLFNLDLLTGDVRRWQDFAASIGLSGDVRGPAVRQTWWVHGDWHHQDSLWPTLPTLGDLSVQRDSLGLGASWRGHLAQDRLHVSADFNWSDESSHGEIQAAPSTSTAAAGVVWDFVPGVSVFVQWRDQTSLSPVTSGLFATDGTGALQAVALEKEHRRGGRAGFKFAAFDDRLTLEMALFQDKTTDLAFRDWSWEQSHAATGPMTIGDGVIRLPFSYATWPQWIREGWSGSAQFQPTRSLSIAANWYVDWRNAGPYVGGNRRASVIARYEADSGFWKNCSGGFAVNARNTLTFNDGYRLEGGVRWDIFAGYRWRWLGGRWTRCQLNLINLSDAPWQPTRFSTQRGRQAVFSFTQEF